MLPAHQRFETDQFLVREGHDRLIEQRQFARIDGAPQVAFDGNARIFFAAHVGGEDFDAVGARTLGAEHRRFGLPHEIAAVDLRAVEEGDADGTGENDLLASHADRRTQCQPLPFGMDREFLGIMRTCDEQRELVAADARQRVLRQQVARQSPRYRQQDAVADDEAKRAVDAAELVDVEEENRRPALRIGLGAGDRHVEPVEEQAAIGQACETVVHGVVHQPFLRPFLIGDVANEADTAHLAMVAGRNRGALEFEPAIGAVGMPQPQLLTQDAAGSFLDAGKPEQEPLLVGWMQVSGKVLHLGRQFAAAEAQCRLDLGVEADLVAPRIPFPDRNASAIDGCQAQLLLAGVGAIDRLAGAESKLRDREADQDDDQHEAGNEA